MWWNVCILFAAYIFDSLYYFRSWILRENAERGLRNMEVLMSKMYVLKERDTLCLLFLLLLKNLSILVV
jgi:hypothetical protein